MVEDRQTDRQIVTLRKTNKLKVIKQVIIGNITVDEKKDGIIVKEKERENKSSKDRTWSAVPDALLGVIQ